MKWLQGGHQNEHCAAEISEHGTKQYKETGETQAGPTKEAPQDLPGRAAHLSPSEKSIGDVLTRQFFGRPQCRERRVDASKSDFSVRIFGCLIHDVAPQLFDNLADFVVIHTAQAPA